MTINPTNAPADVIKFHKNAKKAFIGKSVWTVNTLQQRTTEGIIHRTRIVICDEEGFGGGTLQNGGEIRNVGAFVGAFGSTIDDVRFEKWDEGVYRFWLWNNVTHDVAEFYYHC
jgi:hypothetical protein